MSSRMFQRLHTDGLLGKWQTAPWPPLLMLPCTPYPCHMSWPSPPDPMSASIWSPPAGRPALHPRKRTKCEVVGTLQCGPTSRKRRGGGGGGGGDGQNRSGGGGGRGGPNTKTLFYIPRRPSLCKPPSFSHRYRLYFGICQHRRPRVSARLLVRQPVSISCIIGHCLFLRIATENRK